MMMMIMYVLSMKLHGLTHLTSLHHFISLSSPLLLDDPFTLSPTTSINTDMSQVILYSGDPLSHCIEIAYLNICAESYSILF